MSFYAGVDLHSSNCYLGIVDGSGHRVFNKRCANFLPEILRSLDRFKAELASVAVESTYNWYWLVDGLRENGYPVVLANPSAIKQYEGLKHSDDRWDAFWLAEMQRLNILPTGYIYPKEQRPVRDLLRRRLYIVRKQTGYILSFQSMYSRHTGQKIGVNEVKKLSPSDAATLFQDENTRLSAAHMIYLIQCHLSVIRQIEREILPQVKMRPEYNCLLTIPGVGLVLGLTIMLEVGEITRFADVTNYSSYCRCVGTARLSNGKSKGKGNSKNGNKYLGWAYVEAANYSRRYCPEAKKFHDRKLSGANRIVATKALAHKLARASYWMMRRQEPFKVDLLFNR